MGDDYLLAESMSCKNVTFCIQKQQNKIILFRCQAFLLGKRFDIAD